MQGSQGRCFTLAEVACILPCWPTCCGGLSCKLCGAIDSAGVAVQARGVPVHRLVHEEGSFVITFPNAYHAGFNTGAFA